jgi:hypothetical protein
MVPLPLVAWTVPVEKRDDQLGVDSSRARTLWVPTRTSIVPAPNSLTMFAPPLSGRTSSVPTIVGCAFTNHAPSFEVEPEMSTRSFLLTKAASKSVGSPLIVSGLVNVAPTSVCGATFCAPCCKTNIDPATGSTFGIGVSVLERLSGVRATIE